MPAKMRPRLRRPPAGERGHHLGEEPEHRNREDDGGGLREPEAGELGERPIATELAERRVPVRDEHVQQLPDEYRHGHQQTQRGDQHRPGEERHPAHVHARRPGGEDGGDERDGAGEEAGGSQRGRQREQIDEVGVAAVGPAVVEHRDDGEHCTDEPRPEAGRRESRKASERAPTCNGTMAVARPTTSGSITMKVRPNRCSANSCVSEPMSSHSRDGEMRSMPSSRATTAEPTNPTAAEPK